MCPKRLQPYRVRLPEPRTDIAHFPSASMREIGVVLPHSRIASTVRPFRGLRGGFPALFGEVQVDAEGHKDACANKRDCQWLFQSRESDDSTNEGSG